MAGTDRWSPGKTAGVIVLVLVGLAAVCVGFVWFRWGDRIREGVEMGEQMEDGTTRFETALEERFGAAVRWQITQGTSEGILIVGVPGGPTPDVVEKQQDDVWQIFADAFAAGAPPVTAVALGTAGAPIGARSRLYGQVSAWTTYVVSTADLADRTNIPAPPHIAFFEHLQKLEEDGSGVDIKVEVR